MNEIVWDSLWSIDCFFFDWAPYRLGALNPKPFSNLTILQFSLFFVATFE